MSFFTLWVLIKHQHYSHFYQTRVIHKACKWISSENRVIIKVLYCPTAWNCLSGFSPASASCVLKSLFMTVCETSALPPNTVSPQHACCSCRSVHSPHYLATSLSFCKIFLFSFQIHVIYFFVRKVVNCTLSYLICILFLFSYLYIYMNSIGCIIIFNKTLKVKMCQLTDSIKGIRFWKMDLFLGNGFICSIFQKSHKSRTPSQRKTWFIPWFPWCCHTLPNWCMFHSFLPKKRHKKRTPTFCVNSGLFIWQHPFDQSGSFGKTFVWNPFVSGWTRLLSI